MDAAPDEYCARCGAVVAAGASAIVDGASVCAACAEARASERANKLPRLALFALLAALVPLLVSFATIKQHSRKSVTTTTVTRFLVFSSAKTEGLDFTLPGDPGPVERSYSDPVAIAFGAAALVLGAAGAITARKQKRALAIAVAAAALGAFHVAHGLGVV